MVQQNQLNPCLPMMEGKRKPERTEEEDWLTFCGIGSCSIDMIDDAGVYRILTSEQEIEDEEEWCMASEWNPNASLFPPDFPSILRSILEPLEILKHATQETVSCFLTANTAILGSLLAYTY